MNQRGPNLPSNNWLPLSYNLPLFIHTLYEMSAEFLLLSLLLKRMNIFKFPLWEQQLPNIPSPPPHFFSP